jgi:hypothetical protein
MMPKTGQGDFGAPPASDARMKIRLLAENVGK